MDDHSQWLYSQDRATPPANFIQDDFDPTQAGPSGLHQVALDIPIIQPNTDNLVFPWLTASAQIAGPLGVPSISTSLSFQHQIPPQPMIWASSESVLPGLPPLLPSMPGLEFQPLPPLIQQPDIMPFLGTALQQAQFLEYLTQLNALQAAQDTTRPQSQEDEFIDVMNTDDDCVVVYDKQTELPKPPYLAETETLLTEQPLSQFLNHLTRIMLTEKWKCTVNTVLVATETFLGTGGPDVDPSATELISAVLEIKNILLSFYIVDSTDMDSYSKPEVLLTSITKLVKIINQRYRTGSQTDAQLLQVSASFFAVMILLADAMSLEPGIQEDSPKGTQQPKALLNPIGLTVCARGLKEMVSAFKTWFETDAVTTEIKLKAYKSLKNFFHLIAFTGLTYYQEAVITDNRRLMSTRDQKKGFAFFIVGRVIMALLAGAASGFDSVSAYDQDDKSGNNAPSDQEFLQIFHSSIETAFKRLLSMDELVFQDDIFENCIKRHSLLQLLGKMKQDIWANWHENETLEKQMEMIQLSEDTWTWRDELREVTRIRDEQKILQPFEHGTVRRGPGIVTVIHHPELERTTTVSIVTSGVRRTESVVDIGDLLRNRVSDGWIRTREVAAECAGFSKEEAEIEALTELKKYSLKTRMQFYGTNVGRDANVLYSQKISRITKSNLEKLEDHNYSAKRPNVPVEFVTPDYTEVDNPQEELCRKHSKLSRKLTLNRIPTAPSPESIAQRSILTAHRRESKEDEIADTGPVLYIEKERRKPLRNRKYNNPVYFYYERARLQSLKRYTDAVVPKESPPKVPDSQELPSAKLSEMTIIEEDLENQQDSDFERPSKSAKDNDSTKWYKAKQKEENQSARKRKSVKERLKKKHHCSELEYERRAGVYKKLVSKRNCFCHLKKDLKCDQKQSPPTSLRIHEVIARYSPLRLGEADPIAKVYRPSREIPAFFKDDESTEVLYWEYRIREFGLRLVEFDKSGDEKKFKLWLVLYSFVNKDEASVHSHSCVIEEFTIDQCLKLDQIINILFYAALNWNKARTTGRYGRAIRATVKAAEYFIGKCELSLWKDLPDISKVIVDFQEKPKMTPFAHKWVNWATRKELRQADYERIYYEQMRNHMSLKCLSPKNPENLKKPEFWETIKEFNALYRDKMPSQNFNMLEIEPTRQEPQFPKDLIEMAKEDDSGIDSDAASAVTRVTIKALRKKYKKNRKRGHIESAAPSIVSIEDELESNPQKKSKLTTPLDTDKGSRRKKKRPAVKSATMLQFLRLMESRLPQSVMDDITKCLIMQARIILIGYSSVLPRNAHLTESAVNTIRQTILDQITRNAFFMYRKATQNRLSSGSFDGLKFFEPIEHLKNHSHLYHPKFPQKFNHDDYDRMWLNDAIGNIASNMALACLSRKIEIWDRFNTALFHETESTVLRAYLRELVNELCDIRKVFSGTNGYEIQSFKSQGKSQYQGLFLNKCTTPIALTEPFIVGKVCSADEAFSRFVNFPFTHTQLSTWYLDNVKNLQSDSVSIHKMSSGQLASLAYSSSKLLGSGKLNLKANFPDLPEVIGAENEPPHISDEVVILKEVQESMIGRPTNMDEKWIALIDWRKYYIAYPHQSDGHQLNYDSVEINHDSDKFVAAVFEAPNQTFYPTCEETPAKYKRNNHHRLTPEYDYPLIVSYIQKEAADWNARNRKRVAALRKTLIEERLERETRQSKFNQTRTTEVEALQDQAMETDPSGDIWDYGDGCPLVIDTGSSLGSPMVEDLFSPLSARISSNVQGRFDQKHWNWMEQKRWKAERNEEDLIAETIAMALNPPPYLFKKESVAEKRDRLESERLRKEQEDEQKDEQSTLDEFAKYKTYSGMKSMSIYDKHSEEPMDQEPALPEPTAVDQGTSPNKVLVNEPVILEMEDFALKYGGKPPDDVDVRIRLMGKVFTWEELERKILDVEAKQRQIAENERKRKAMREAMIRKAEIPKPAVNTAPVPTVQPVKQVSPVKTIQSQPVPLPVRGKFAPIVRRGSVRTNLRSDLLKPIPIIEAHTLRKPTRPRIIGPARKSSDSPQNPTKTPTSPTVTPVFVQKVVSAAVPTKVTTPTKPAENPTPAAHTVDKANDDALFKRPLLPAPRSRIRSASVPVKQPTRQDIPVLRLRTPRTNLANPGPLRIKSFQNVVNKPVLPSASLTNVMKKSASLPILRLRTTSLQSNTQISTPKKLDMPVQLIKSPATDSTTLVQNVKPKPEVKMVPKLTLRLPSSKPQVAATPAPVAAAVSRPAAGGISKNEKIGPSPKKNTRTKKMPVLPIPICKPSTSNARCGPRSLRFWNEYIPDREIRKWLKSGEINPPASWELTRTVVERTARAKKIAKSTETTSVVDLTEQQPMDTADVLAAVMDIESEEHLSDKVAEQAAIWASIEARKAEEKQEIAVLMHIEWESESTNESTSASKKVESKMKTESKTSKTPQTKEVSQPKKSSASNKTVTPTPEQSKPQELASSCKVKLSKPLVRSKSNLSITNLTSRSESIAASLSEPIKKPEAAESPTPQLANPPSSPITDVTAPEKKMPKTRKRGHDSDPVIPAVEPSTQPTEPYEYFYIGPDGLEYPIENIVAVQYTDDDNDYIPQIALLNSERSRTPTTPKTPTHAQKMANEGENNTPTYQILEPAVSTKPAGTSKLVKIEKEALSTFEESSAVKHLTKLVEAVPEQKNEVSVNRKTKVSKNVEIKQETTPSQDNTADKIPMQVEPIQTESEQLDRLSEGSLDDALLDFAANSELNIDEDAESLPISRFPEEKSPSPTNPWYNRLIKYLEDTGIESSPEGPEPPTVDESQFQKELLAAVQELSMKEPERCMDVTVSRTVQALRDADTARKSGSSSPIAGRLRRRSATQAAVVQRRNARRHLRGKTKPAGFEVPSEREVALSRRSEPLPRPPLVSTPEVGFTFGMAGPPFRTNFGTIQHQVLKNSPPFTTPAPMLPVVVGSPQTLNITPPNHFTYSVYGTVNQRMNPSFYSPPTAVPIQSGYLPRYVIEPTPPAYSFNEDELLRPIGPFDISQDTLLDYDEEELLGPEMYFDENAAADLKNLFEPVIDEPVVSSQQKIRSPRKTQTVKTPVEATEIQGTNLSENEKKKAAPVRKPRKSRLACELTAAGEMGESKDTLKNVAQDQSENVTDEHEVVIPKPRRGRPPRKQSDIKNVEAELTEKVDPNKPGAAEHSGEKTNAPVRRRKTVSHRLAGGIEANREGSVLKESVLVPATTKNIEVTAMMSSDILETQKPNEICEKEQPAEPVDVTMDVGIIAGKQINPSNSGKPLDPADDNMDLGTVERERSLSPIDFSVFHRTGMFGVQSAPRLKRKARRRRSVKTALAKNTENLMILDLTTPVASPEAEPVEPTIPDPFETLYDQISINSYGERVIAIDEDIQLVHFEQAEDDETGCLVETPTSIQMRKRKREHLDRLDREIKQEDEDELNPPSPPPKEEDLFKAPEVDHLIFTLDYHFDEPDFYMFPPDCLQVDPELLTSLLDRIDGDDPSKIYDLIFADHVPENRHSNYTDTIVDCVLDNIPDGMIYKYNAAEYKNEDLVMNVIHEFSVIACRVVLYKRGQLKFRSSVDMANLFRFISKMRVDFFKALMEHSGLSEKEQHKQQVHWDHACLAVLHFCTDTLARFGASTVACPEKATHNAIRLRIDAILYGLYSFVQQGGLVRTYLAMAEEGEISINRGLIFTCEVYLKNLDSQLRIIKEQLQESAESRVQKSVENIISPEQLNILRSQTRLIDRDVEEDSSCSRGKCLPFVFTSVQAAEIHEKVLHKDDEINKCSECYRDFRHKLSLVMHMTLNHHKKFFTEQEQNKQ